MNDALGTRMKEFYEYIPKTKLMRRCPVALRIDGKAFHTFTRGFQKPFDRVLVKSMQRTMKYLCENIQGCVFGYTQSDEITLILVDYQKLTSCAWFDYEVQKMCSVAASMATMAFNKFFAEEVEIEKLTYKTSLVPQCVETQKKIQEYHTTLDKAVKKGAMFDCRAFNIPKEEVTNLVYWRQLDASKNSIQMVARTFFSDNQLHKKNTSEMQDMLFNEYKVNWNSYPTYLKRGSACIKNDGTWCVDIDMPILKEKGREYLDKLIYIGE